ncbi:glycosyltransferase family 4 protein [Lysinibacillus parviboronicapiens]|uniref:Glycosyltransferase involved in cell wall biosynthesis n=1 Tax=Lysinibacillus parviboronicapiens TaxID=436516 RepID=A0ABV2PI57_9BACI|nr:glycosyltransferase family 4 protein [Lysinibacillus parviboronicapiens]
MKKILFGASVYQHLTAFHRPFMKWFQEKGYEVHAVGSNSLGRKAEIEEMGVICHDIDFERLPLSRRNINAYKQLKKLFSTHYFDLIHVHTPTASFLIRYAAKKAQQGKIVYTAHGFHFFKGSSTKNWLAFYPAEKLAAKWTDALIVMNKEDFISGERLGFKKNEDLFFVNGVGVDLKEYKVNNPEGDNFLKTELKLENDAVLITCVAELSKRKNQFFLLENWGSIISKAQNVHLVFVGKGPDEEKIKTFINEHDISNVHLLGYRTDVPKIISASDIITLVSKQEGLPRCLMEGMAVGKPIISTNIRGSADLVSNEQTGFLVDLDDSENLIKSIIELAENEEMRYEFGHNAKIKIEKYSINNVLKDMENIYSKLL